MAQASFFYDVAYAFQHFTSADQASSIDKYSYHTLAIILDVTLFERDLQLYYEGLVLADRYGDAYVFRELDHIERNELPAPTLWSGNSIGNRTHQTRLLSLFQSDTSSAEAVSAQRPRGDDQRTRLEQTSASQQGKKPTAAITTAASQERVKVPQLASIAEHPGIVSSKPDQKSEKKAHQRKLEEGEAPVTRTAMPVPRSAKLGGVIQALEHSLDAITTEPRPVVMLESSGLDEGKRKARDTPSIATRPLTCDVTVHPMIAQGDYAHWDKLINRLQDPTENQQDVLSELYFFPDTVPTSDYEVAAREQTTNAILEEVNAVRKMAEESPNFKFKGSDVKSLFDHRGMLRMEMFGLGGMSGDEDPLMEEFMRGASKPGYWKEYARKEFAARRLQPVEGENATQSPIESSQDHSTMSPLRPQITSARSNSADIWESDAITTTKPDKNGLASRIPREVVSRIKRRG